MMGGIASPQMYPSMYSSTPTTQIVSSQPTNSSQNEEELHFAQSEEAKVDEMIISEPQAVESTHLEENANQEPVSQMVMDD